MKFNTSALDAHIRSKLIGVCPAVTNEFKTASGEDPYIIFYAEQVQMTDGMIQYELEINVVGSDKRTVESMCDEIQYIFDHYNYMDEKISVTTYLLKRMSVTENDKSKSRRRLTFELHFYSKEE